MKLDKKYIKPLIMIATLGITITTIYYGGRYIKKKFFNKNNDLKETDKK